MGKDIKSNNKNKKGKKKKALEEDCTKERKLQRNLIKSFIPATDMMMMKEDCN